MNNLTPSPNAPPHVPGTPSGFQAYPRMLYAAGLPALTVQNEEQEKVARTKGYDNKPLAINDRPEPAIPTTTDNAVRHAYETLKREHREIVDDFNRKHEAIRKDRDALAKRNKELENTNYSLTQSVNGLRSQFAAKNAIIAELKTGKKATKEEAAAIAEHVEAGYAASAEGEPEAVATQAAPQEAQQ